jgi:flagellar motor switch/type III secretory pathway protein FliN
LARLIETGRASASWLGAPIELAVRPSPSPAPIPDAPWPSAVLETDGALVGLTIDPRVAAAIVDRTLGGDGTDRDPAAGPWGELERGVLAYAIGRWLGPPWSLRAVFAYPAAMIEAWGAEPRPSLGLDVTVGVARGRAELWIPEHGSGPASLRDLPSWTGDLPLVLRATVGDATLDARELARLGVGDVVLPDRLDVTRGVSGALEGHAHLSPDGGGWGMRCAVDRDTLRVEAHQLGAFVDAGSTEGEMSDDAAIERMSGTPVTLTIEIARITLPLRQVAELAPGSVVSTGRGPHGRVTLVAGDRPIAVGELVDVDGELGVRILELQS